MTAGAAAGDCGKFNTRMHLPQNNNGTSTGITPSLQILKAAASWYNTISTGIIHLAIKDIYFNYKSLTEPDNNHLFQQDKLQMTIILLSIVQQTT